MIYVQNMMSIANIKIKYIAARHLVLSTEFSNKKKPFCLYRRYNHRIQVLDPAGRFLRAFGSQGTADGKFNYPWGITTDALGFIYVCDKENHRIQVWHSAYW